LETGVNLDHQCQRAALYGLDGRELPVAHLQYHLSVATVNLQSPSVTTTTWTTNDSTKGAVGWNHRRYAPCVSDEQCRNWPPSCLRNQALGNRVTANLQSTLQSTLLSSTLLCATANGTRIAGGMQSKARVRGGRKVGSFAGRCGLSRCHRIRSSQRQTPFDHSRAPMLSALTTSAAGLA
jgi:hypothetical protein